MAHYVAYRQTSVSGNGVQNKTLRLHACIYLLRSHLKRVLSWLKKSIYLNAEMNYWLCFVLCYEMRFLYCFCCSPLTLDTSDSKWRQHMSSNAVETECSGVNMSDPAAQALQPRLLQAQSGGSAGSSSASTGSGSGNSDPARPGLSQQQRASQKKAQVRAFPRAKKLEKLGVFSACKVASAASQSSPSLKSTSRYY